MASDAITVWEWVLKVSPPSLGVSLWLSLDRIGKGDNLLTHSWVTDGAEFFCGMGDPPVHPQIIEEECPELSKNLPSSDDCQFCIDGRVLLWHSVLPDEARRMIIQELEEVLAI